MPPVEQLSPASGNPDASLDARHRPHRHRRGAGASAAHAVRGPCDHAVIVGSAAQPHAGPLGGPGDHRRGHSSGCRGHSGCTARLARGSGRTGTGRRVVPCAPRYCRSAGRMRPSAPRWRGTAFIARCRARNGRQACRQSDRCRAHLLRHGPRCTAAGHRPPPGAITQAQRAQPP
jgi:hypothetical protein